MCRDLSLSADDLRRRLTEMADECDDRAREIEQATERPPKEVKDAPTSADGQSFEPMTLSIKDTCSLLGLGRSTIYKLIGDGQLRTLKIGNRTLVKTASIRTLVEAQN